MKKIWIVGVVWLIFLCPIGGRAEPLLGFTRWPADLSLEGLKIADDFIKEHGAIVALHLEQGVPWPEALANGAYSSDVRAQLSYRPPAGHKLFVSINALNMDRSGLAPYWGEKDNMPLPKPWDTMALDDPRVAVAFNQFAERVARTLHPDYLAIGVEANILLSKKPELWPAYVNLYRGVYARLKRLYPAMPVFFTVDVLHLRGLYDGANPLVQEREVRALLDASDLFAMSVYPFMSVRVSDPFPDDFFAFSRAYGKPIAVSETGFTSRPVRTKGVVLYGSGEAQARYYDILLKSAFADDYAFVITYASTDFDRMIAKLPEQARAPAAIWQYTGLQTFDKTPKAALTLWDRARRTSTKP